MSQMSPMEPFEVDSQAVIDYREQARDFLNHSWGYLKADDLHQASEKGWAAAAWMAKAVAETHGWEYARHSQFFPVMRQCEVLADDVRVRDLWPKANVLHEFFYIRKRFLSPETIQGNLSDIEILLDILEPLTALEAEAAD